MKIKELLFFFGNIMIKSVLRFPTFYIDMILKSQNVKAILFFINFVHEN